MARRVPNLMWRRPVGFAAACVAAALLAACAMLVGPSIAQTSDASTAAGDVEESEPVSIVPAAADFCYAVDMIPHHQQAVEMSEIVLAKDGIHDRTDALARWVATDQANEILMISDWIEAWRRDLTSKLAESASAAPAPADSHAAHSATSGSSEPTSAAAFSSADEIDAFVDCTLHAGASHGEAHTTMPGMMSDDEMQRLHDADGPTGQIIYLELMIPHHEGALSMSREVIVEGNNYFIAQLARHILDEQQREVQAMLSMIDDLSPE